MKKLKCGIIGCGAISETHISSITENNLSEIIAVCDIKPAKSEAAALSIGKNVRAFSNYKDMIGVCEHELDVVHICTPHYLHAEMAIFAMERGIDVYLEKPCALNSADAKRIIEVSERTGRRVCVSFQNRVVNTTSFAKKIIESGKLGKLLGMKGIVTWQRSGAYYTDCNWRGKWATEGGGVLINQSIHTLDLLYYFGGKVKKVEGSVALRKNADIIEVEDTAEATIWFENGVSAIFYATNCHVTSSPAELELVCEKGSLLISNDVLYENVDGKLIEACSNDGIKVGKSVWGAGHITMIRGFYDAICGKDSYYCDIRDSYQVLEIIEAIYKTSANKLR